MNNTTDDGLQDTLHTLEIITFFYLCFLSFSTVVLNGLVLLTIYKDPLKCLRSPTACFIAGLTSTNFLTGFIVEPMFAGLYIWHYSGADAGSFYDVDRVAEVIAFVTINASLLIILALAVSQYIAVTHSGLYDRIVSRNKAKLGIICIFAYSLLFSVLPEIGAMDLWTFYEVDMYLHTTLISVLLVTIYVVMYCKFRRLWGTSHGAEVRGSQESEQNRQQREREFTKMTFILTLFLIVTVWPYAATLYVWQFKSLHYNDDLTQLIIAFEICRNILFLKFALDPLIFAWRLQKYRKSLVFMLGAVCKCLRRRDAEATVTQQGQDSSALDGDVELSVVG